MTKYLLTTVLLATSLTATAASDYVNFSVDQKDKVNSFQVNQVNRVNIGHKFDNGFIIEGRVENEIVHNPNKHEGLMQIKLDYDFGKVFGWTPYAAVAVGQKSKATTNFPYYAPEAGVKTDIGNWTLKFNHRYRTPFDEVNHYTTSENYVQVGYKLTKKDTIAYKYGKERGDSNYNINGISWNHSF